MTKPAVRREGCSMFYDTMRYDTIR